eukprot:TRINITY_DN3430_c0_g3_i1.p1 TRINITY_DN3430_c0_g3~~TRINITY_DN3430_c0_g3_i1.p1  ORF type:complete len:674 (+),score=146.91 TRINITY_DN3430_c0_g3_i1:223-2244(+)
MSKRYWWLSLLVLSAVLVALADDGNVQENEDIRDDHQDCLECEASPPSVQLLQQALRVKKTSTRSAASAATILSYEPAEANQHENPEEDGNETGDNDRSGSGTATPKEENALDGEGRPAASVAQVLKNCLGYECLERYVKMDPEDYAMETLHETLTGTTKKGVEWTGTIIQLTSQRWLSEAEVQPTAWNHALVVINTPGDDGDAVAHDGWATLYIAFGTYGSEKSPAKSVPSDDADVMAAAEIAAATGAPAAVLFNVPAEWLTFTADPTKSSRFEDSEVAWTWATASGLSQPAGTPPGEAHLDAENWQPRPELLIELPMTKAVVRAMDAISSVYADSVSPISNFALTGTSKRGNLCWHAAAVDDRVMAIAPMVKALDFSTFGDRTLRSFGGMPVAARDYYQKGIFGDFMKSRQGLWFMNITDPMNYLDRFEGLPKLVISASNDEFVIPDNTRWWYHSVPGPKWNAMVPNSGHIVGGKQVLAIAGTLASFFRSVMPTSMKKTLTAAESFYPMPLLDWEINKGSSTITAKLLSSTNHKPKVKSVKLWEATTCDSHRRDFRLHNADFGEACKRCGKELGFGSCENQKVGWKSAELAPTAAHSQTWNAAVEVPSDGRWIAFFIEFEFDGGLKLSTDVSVMPDKFPFAGCDQKSKKNCNGVGLVLDELARQALKLRYR